MKNISDEITIQCPSCQELIYTLVSRIKENDCVLCPSCFTSNEYDVDRLVEYIGKLMQKVEEQRKKEFS